MRKRHHIRRGVSILARPEGRALLVHPSAAVIYDEFQSSPAPKGGRYLRGIVKGKRADKFQSSPAPKGGRYLRGIVKGKRADKFQSSPAPKGGRYLDSQGRCKCRLRRFNPRPPRRAGATCRWRECQIATFVSILARPEGRALPHWAHQRQPNGQFQSSPAPKGGRYTT